MASAVPPPSDSVVHWYDFVCPFCYLAQPDNRALVDAGYDLVELAFLAHPEIPQGGLPIDPRGPRFEMIAQLAAARGMPLRWTGRLPYTVPTLAAAEWIRLNRPAHAEPFRRAIFTANFADGQDIGDRSVILHHAERVGVAPDDLLHGMTDGSGDAAVQRSTALGRKHGVRGTPAWLYKGRLSEGLQDSPARIVGS